MNAGGHSDAYGFGQRSIAVSASSLERVVTCLNLNADSSQSSLVISMPDFLYSFFLLAKGAFEAIMLSEQATSVRFPIIETNFGCNSSAFSPRYATQSPNSSLAFFVLIFSGMICST